MYTRELWQGIMHYGDFDRMPVIHWLCWQETRDRWIREGMPEDADEREFLNAAPHWTFVGVNRGLYPLFDEETIEGTDEYRVFRDRDGVVQKDWKNRSCIPQYIDFTLKEGGDWGEYKKRLQPDPGRFPENIEQQIASAESSGLAIAMGTASIMGW